MKFILREGFKKLKNYKKLTFATFLTSTISYLVLGMFLLITLTLLENFNTFQAAETKIVTFVNSDVSNETINSLTEKLNILDGISNIEYISSEEGLKNLQKNFDNKDIIDEFKEDNPIPHTYILNFKNKKSADIAYKVIQNIEEITEIKYESGYLNEINEVLRNFKLSLFTIVIGLLLSSAIFIVIVISLTIHNQRQNIKIMLLTGAPIKYISQPFIIQGLLISTVSALLSSTIILYLCDEYFVIIEKIFPFITAIKLEQYNFIPVFIVGIGAFIGFIGSFFASKSEIKKVIKKM